MRTYFFENVFFFYLLYPWKSQTNSSIPGNCAKLRYIPWKFQDQKPWPWKFNIIFSWSRLCGNSTCYFFDTPGNSISSAQSPLPMFVFFLVFLHTFFTFVSSFEGTSYKNLKIQPPDLLFIFAFTSFYVSRYHLSKTFRTSFNNIWKKYFRHKFSCFNRFAQIPRPALH